MVNLQPLVQAPAAVVVHFVTVVPAFVLGTWLLFFSTKGSRYHRAAGKTYLTLMAITAFAAIFIRSFAGWSVSIGPLKLGLIHLFILLTYHGIWRTLTAIKAGDLRTHQASMRGLYFGALIVAGLLAFAPGRIMHRMFFG